MRRPTNEHEIFRGRMKQGNSRTEFGKNCQERYARAIRPDIYESMNLRPENVNDDSTNDYLDKLVKEQMEAESNENRQMARLQSYFLWSEQKIIELQAEIKSLQEEVSQHIRSREFRVEKPSGFSKGYHPIEHKQVGRRKRVRTGENNNG